MSHMPFRILAIRIYTSSQFLRSGDGGACFAVRLELERTSKPGIEGEDPIYLSKRRDGGWDKDKEKVLGGKVPVLVVVQL